MIFSVVQVLFDVGNVTARPTKKRGVRVTMQSITCLHWVLLYKRRFVYIYFRAVLAEVIPKTPPNKQKILRQNQK